MIVRQPHHPELAEVSLTRVLTALGDPIRLGLVQLLADDRERAWGDLDVPVAKSTLSHHLKVLRDAGITRTRQQGTRCYVQLRRADLDIRFPGLLAALLSIADADAITPTPAQSTSTRGTGTSA
jgi:DNA-binding transcriptional ArsR family regulator